MVSHCADSISVTVHMLKYCICNIPTILAIIMNHPSPLMFIAIILWYCVTLHPPHTLTIHHYPHHNTHSSPASTCLPLTPPQPSFTITIATITIPPWHCNVPARFPCSLLFTIHSLLLISIHYPLLHLPYSSHFMIPDCGSYLNLIPFLCYLFHLWSRPTSLSSLHPPSISHTSLVHVEVGHYIVLCR